MLECVITETKDIEEVTYDWGAVKWVANGEVAPACEQSFGLVHILPGKTNPAHCHTAAEEIVFMLLGECDVRVGDRTMKIVPGQTLVHPVGRDARGRQQRMGAGRVRVLVLGHHPRHDLRRPQRARRAPAVGPERPAVVSARRRDA
jgi:mannose-6-phosphate isomerase-like protein (cupin superfamily)